jgi:hypothetical protein
MNLFEQGTPCVIARLAGGLGNQLFMYAFAKALAQRNDVPLFLDVSSGFAKDRNYRRNFLLDYLIPQEQRATLWQAQSWPLIGRTLLSLRRKRNARLPLAQRDYLRERKAAFDEEIYHLHITRPIIVDGYWQTQRYFDDLPLRDLLQFPALLTQPVAAEYEAIHTSSTPVCLAVRRYEEIPKLKRPVHILDADFYQRAMTKMEESVKNPHYFVFAQDMQWAKNNIRSAHPMTFASKKDADCGAIQDLYLMTQCRHHIISNSTLHWWAAWLATPNVGIVLTPTEGWSNLDILPAYWIQVT